MSTTAFSYAQAARGQTTPQIATPPLSSPAPTAPTTAEEKEDGTFVTVSQGSVSSTPPTVSDPAKLPAKASRSEPSPGPGKVDSDAASAADSTTLVGTIAESTSNFSVDDALNTPASDKNGHVSASPDDTIRKGRKGKPATTSDRDGEKSSSTDGLDKDRDVLRVELSPAPLPTVNIWDQRRRDLAAKSKQSSIAPSKTAATEMVVDEAPVVTGTSAKSREPKKNDGLPVDTEANPESNGVANGTKAQPRRSSDSGPSEQTHRSGPRGSRLVDKDDKNGSSRDRLPSVQDATAWPTPELAAVGEDPKVKASEKTDNGDKDSQEEAGSSKSRKKGWVPLAFVPTVNFQTPIPNVRGSKPKTGGRGGRDPSSRGGYNGITNGTTSVEKMASANPSSADKASPEPRDSSKESNANPLPRPPSQISHLNKRFSADASHSREPRKSATTFVPDKSKESASDNAELSGKAEFVRKGNNTGVVNSDNPGLQHTTRSTQSDRRLTSTTKGNEPQLSYAKDGGLPHKEHQGQAPRERNERTERSSRGSFRGGRGGHGGSSSQSHHLSHSAYQSSGQRIAGSNTYSNSTAILPPTTVPYSPPPQQFSFGNPHNGARPGRNPSRAQSVSHTHGFGVRLQNGVGHTHRLHTHASHVSTSLATDFQIHPYPLSLYNPYMDPELLQGLIAQLDYYFSLENLCKDVFLRKKMDDQGFVSLFVVANFKRMAELAPSIEFIRIACEQSSTLDYVVDQDHTELIRSRFHWDSFTLPSGERDEEARKPGPDMRTVNVRSAHVRAQQAFIPVVAPGYPPILPAVFSTNGNEAIYQAYDHGIHADHPPVHNGVTDVNGGAYTGESQLCAAVPDFSPSGISGAPTTLEEFQNCPDDQVKNLVVLVGSDPDATTNGQLDQSHNASLKPANNAAGTSNRDRLEENHSR